MDFLRRFLLRLTEPSTWGAVSVLPFGFGATHEDWQPVLHPVAFGAVMLGVFLPKPKSGYRSSCPGRSCGYKSERRRPCS